MKNRALLALLCLSVTANVWLTWKPIRAVAPANVAPPAASQSAAIPGVPAPSLAKNDARNPSSGSVASPNWIARLHTARSDADIRAIVADLRAAGVPGNVIRAFVNELLNVRFAGREPTQPFWRRNTPLPEFTAATQALTAERQALLESLLGDDASPAATLTPAQRELRYGRLSDDKLNAVVRIEREYDEMRAKTTATRETNLMARFNGELGQQRLLEQEKLRDLATVLSPEELEQYELRNSQTAQSLMRNLGGLEVMADEFAALYRLQRSVDLQHPFTFSATPDMDALAARMQAEAAAREQAHAVLSDARYYKYLESVDFGYAAVARFTAAYPQITPETTLKVHRLQTELQNAWQDANRTAKAQGGKPTPPDTKSFDARLVELLGPEVAAAYKKQGNGRMFVVTSGGG